jgi:serine/threonine protein kinase
MDPTHPSADSDALVGGVLPGNLRVLERLGRTSLGPLYRAQYPGCPPIALTLLDASASPRNPAAVSASSSRLVQQLQRACQIRHPNVAALIAVAETYDGRTYALAELLTGECLSGVLAARSALPTHEAVDICLQAAAGLQAAHEFGVIHGSISPSTILLANAEGERPLVKLIRFGLDLDAEAGRHALEDRYTSPERLAGNAPDEVGDVFSLGAVLHHLLTGAPPGAPLARAALPKALGRVVDRALAASPGKRFRTVASFAEALADAVEISGRPRRPLLGRRLLIAAIAALLAPGIWLGWSRHRADGAGDRSEQEVGMRTPERVGTAPTRPVPLDAERRARELPTKGSEAARPVQKRGEPRTPPPAAEPVETSSTPSSKAAVAASEAVLSPFRRSHPWAAHTDGRFYFPSSCPLALGSADLVYFTSESEARATGRSRSTEPGCS